MKVDIHQDFDAKRRAGYEARGLTMDALVIALIEGDEAELERIRSEREAVKAEIPKGKGGGE